MKIYRDCTEKLNTRTTVALGCFDGVHVAHAAVIAEAVAQARKNGTEALVFCFAEPPKNAFLPSPVPLITELEEKTALIAELGADILVCPDFTHGIARMDGREFVRDILLQNAGAVHLVSGRSYSFGRGGEGNPAMLAELCRELGIGYTIVEDVKVDGEEVSSSEIRRAVAQGRLGHARALLGRDFSLALERKDGEYTCSPRHLVPPDGEYPVRILHDNKNTQARAYIRTRNGICTMTFDTDTASEKVRIEFCSDPIEKI